MKETVSGCFFSEHSVCTSVWFNQEPIITGGHICGQRTIFASF